MQETGKIRSMVRFGTLAVLMTCLAMLSGCDTAPPQFRFNAVEMHRQEKLQLSDGQSFAPEYKPQIDILTTTLFGTPDAPRFPFLAGEDDDAHAIIAQENLDRAAGAVASDRQDEHRGLYREHCVHCHGITGDGAGPTALTLNPYPRDFRLGKFKFKSTPLRTPPTDADLERIIRDGIPGTAMPSFKTLREEEVAALVDYVKYLSIRGEFERQLIAEVGSANGEPLLDLSAVKLHAPDKSVELPEEVKDRVYELCGDLLVDGVIARWLDRDDAVTEVDAVPEVLLDASHETFHQMASEGQKLFAGKANCVQCHGPTGLGDGLVGNYDDWTSEWLKTPGVDVTNKETYQDFLDLGALPPRPISSRNLHFGVYRGGGSPADLYRRIYDGIEGTPMPSSRTLSTDEIWALVAYVRSLPYTD